VPGGKETGDSDRTSKRGSDAGEKRMRRASKRPIVPAKAVKAEAGSSFKPTEGWGESKRDPIRQKKKKHTGGGGGGGLWGGGVGGGVVGCGGWGFGVGGWGFFVGWVGEGGGVGSWVIGVGGCFDGVVWGWFLCR